MKILIFGASGSGTTTLANEVAKNNAFVHLDVDDYYWKPTDPPFHEKIPLDERNKNLTIDFYEYEKVIISGSMVSWRKEWESAFDLAVFIRLENDTRMERLRKREQERYGNLLKTNKQIQVNSAAFLEWANQYENQEFTGRSLKVHTDWVKLLDCPILKLEGKLELSLNYNTIINQIKHLKKVI